MFCSRCGFANAEGVWQCAQCGTPLQNMGAAVAAPPVTKSTPVLLIVLAVVAIGGVCVLGILAAVAIPAFTRYTKRSKTSEASGNIARIYQGEVTYFAQSAERGTAQFLSAGATPAVGPSAQRFPASSSQWTSDPRWAAIGFSIDGPHYYQYQVTTSGSGTAATFTVTAVGDLDGDGIYSTFSRSASVSNGEVTGTSLYITNELE